MNKILSAREVVGDFDAALRWAEENREGLVVEWEGKPAAALIAYGEYEELQRLRRSEKKRQALEAIRSIRKDVQVLNQDLSAEEAYRLAGFSEEVIRETIAKDYELAKQAEIDK